MNIKNLAIQLIVILFTCFKKKATTKTHSILLVSTTALGDTLWATPVIASLKKALPDAEIAILTSSIGKRALQKNPHLKGTFLYRGFFSLFSLYRQLKKAQIDTIIVLHSSQRLILPFCALLGANTIIGTQGMNKGLDSLLTHAIPLKPQHEIERRLALLKVLGIQECIKTLEFYCDQEEKNQAQRWLIEQGLDPNLPLIGLHAGASGAFKEWPKENFTLLAKALIQEGYQVVFTGVHTEKKLLAFLKKRVPQAFATLPELPLGVFAALLQHFSLFITNDTGPMHLAFAIKTPTLALFTPTDSNLCGPLDLKQVKVIQKDPTCLPCLKKSCPFPFCLQQIGVEEVLKEANILLKQSKKQKNYCQTQ